MDIAFAANGVFFHLPTPELQKQCSWIFTVKRTTRKNEKFSHRLPVQRPTVLTRLYVNGSGSGPYDAVGRLKVQVHRMLVVARQVHHRAGVGSRLTGGTLQPTVQPTHRAGVSGRHIGRISQRVV